MTTIIRDEFDPADKNLLIAHSGDRDLIDVELRELGYIEDFKLQRLGDAFMADGFVAEGLVPSVKSVTNHLPWSNDFAEWSAVNLATLNANATTDRYGDLTAHRLIGQVGQDSYFELDTLVAADGRVVFAVDLKQDTTPLVDIALFDGVAEIARQQFTVTPTWQRCELPFSGTWSVGATTITARIYPGPGSNPGTVFATRAQVEPIAAGDPMVAGRYIETTGQAASGFGNVVALTEGVAYVAGLPRPFAASTLTFDPLVVEGQDLIYGEFAERYYEGAVYPELENPYNGEPGNDHVREQTALVLEDTTDAEPPIDPVPTNPQYRSKKAVPILQFDRATGLVTPVVERSKIVLAQTSGDLHGARILPQSIPEDRFDLRATEGQGTLLGMVGRRLRNQSGNFVVTPTGALPSIEQDMATTSAVRAKVNPLDGYTQGRAHYLTVPQYVETPLQVSTNQRLNENHTFYTGTDLYKLAKPNVVNIDSLTAIFEVSETITRGPVAGGADELSNTPVFQIVSVEQGMTTFDGNPGGDYIQNGDQVDWSPAGMGSSEPVPGTSYNVTYRYTRTWPVGEFQLTDGLGVPAVPGTHVKFIGANRPVDTLPFAVNYDYGQGRVDLIFLGPDGLQVAQGQPSDHPAPPPVAQGTMPLWEIPLAYNTLGVTFTPRFTVGVSMAALAAMQAQVDDLTYNVAQLATNIDLRDRNSGLKGMIVDPFIDDRQFDINAAFLALPGERAARIADGKLKMARDTVERRLAIDWATGTKPGNATSTTIVRVDRQGTTGIVAGVYNLAVAAGTTPGTMKYTYNGVVTDNVPANSLNQALNGGIAGKLIVNTGPAVGAGVDAVTIVVRTTFAVTNAWSGLPYAATARIEQNAYSTDASVNPFANYDLIPPLITLSTSAWGDFSGGVTTQFTVRGTKFQPNEAGIDVRLDGTLLGSVAANAQGEFEQSFVVNRNPTGIVTAEGAGGTPSAVLSSFIVWPRRDPLAQTFAVPEDGYLTHVDLYFAARSLTEPALVTLRTVQAGYPTEEVLALVTLQPASVNTGGLVTRVTFKEPVMVEGGVSYAVVVASNSGDYRLQLAQLGKQNLGPAGGYITANPYGAGVMLASSDGRTWTPYQDQDLRFAVGMAKFQPSATLYLLKENFPLGITSFELFANQRVLFGATIAWSYSVDGEVSWQPFDPTREVALAEVANDLVVRAQASTTKDYAGVALAAENVLVMAHKADIKSSYVGLQSSLLQNTSSAKAYIKSALKPGTDAAPYATNDGGATWVAGTLDATRQIDLATGLAEYEYSFTFAGPDNEFRGRIDLTATNPVEQAEVDESSFVIL